MMQKQYFIAVLILEICTWYAAVAQTTIRGRVIDQQSLPMEFVNVVVLNPSDSTLVEGYVTKAG